KNQGRSVSPRVMRPSREPGPRWPGDPIFAAQVQTNQSLTWTESPGQALVGGWPGDSERANTPVGSSTAPRPRTNPKALIKARAARGGLPAGRASMSGLDPPRTRCDLRPRARRSPAGATVREPETGTGRLTAGAPGLSICPARASGP